MIPKVMVVDDTEGIRDLLSAILEREGYETTLKASAAELTAAFAQSQPDIILLDLVLPDGDGLELLPQIKKQWPDTEVIVLTGHATLTRRWKRPSAGPTISRTNHLTPKPCSSPCSAPWNTNG